MAIDRREFLCLGLSPILLGPMSLQAECNTQRLLSCCSNEHGEHLLSMIDDCGTRLWNIGLPARGHGIAIDPVQRKVAVFARRPGTFVWILDLSLGEPIQKITAEAGRHFYGHGLFTPDGTYLLCSENNYQSGQGVIGVYQVDDGYRRVAEFSSQGVEPHQIRLLADGRTLIVANGGIRTHPDLPRIKLNLDSMRANLAYIDLHSGRLLHRHEPEEEWRQLSIRHIDVSHDDRVAIAMQFEGEPTLSPPLIALQQGDQPIRMLTAPPTIQQRLKNYCGDIAFSSDSRQFAVSSPRGGLVTFWSAEGDFLGLHEQSDVCGLASAQNGDRDFLVSDGNGNILKFDVRLGIVESHFLPDCRWDNHLVMLSST